MSSTLSPSDRPGVKAFTVATTTQAAAAASMTAGVELDNATLVRLGENAVFQDGKTLVRVSRPHVSRGDLRRLVVVARWLENERLPAARLLPFDQPIDGNGLAVTFWCSLGKDAPYGTAKDLGELLRRLHGLERPEYVPLDVLDPFERAARRIEVVPIAEADRAYLRHRLAELADAYGLLKFALPRGHVHDDASVGNVLLDKEGTPTLIDLDGFAIGPREWDLVLTAMYYERFGWHTEAEYQSFVEAYGYDVMAWEGYETLADVRELLMVTWIAQRADESPGLAAEVARRVESLRTGASRRDWQPY